MLSWYECAATSLYGLANTTWKRQTSACRSDDFAFDSSTCRLEILARIDSLSRTVHTDSPLAYPGVRPKYQGRLGSDWKTDRLAVL